MITFFGNIPNSFPALLESLKINVKAAKTGFDWEKIDDIYDKLYVLLATMIKDLLCCKASSKLCLQ
jgi:uncharacterized protein YabN with tetrapyrrole methylase and pyrophosphatase domain